MCSRRSPADLINLAVNSRALRRSRSHRAGIARVRTLILAAALAWIARGNAQGLIFNFSQNKETYVWEDSLFVDRALSNRIQVVLGNHSVATLIDKSLFVDQRDRWQKQANTNLRLLLNPRRTFSWGFIARNDYNRLEDRRVTTNQLGLEQVWRLFAGAELNSQVSYSETSRRNADARNLDRGLLQKLALSYDRRVAGLGKIAANYDQELNLLRRTPDKNFEVGASFDASRGTRQLELRYNGSYRQNKYFSGLESFERVATQNRYEHQGELLAAVPVFRKLQVSLNSNYSYRRFEYLQVDEGLAGGLGRDNLTSTFSYQLEAAYAPLRQLTLKTSYLYRGSDEEYGSVLSGQDIKHGELRLSSLAALGRRDSLTAYGAFSVTAYSGKRESELFSDRDRVFRLGQVDFSHRFSDFLTFSARGLYQFDHQVYISGTLSANNNHNITYLLKPELSWTPAAWLELNQGWLMEADYIYYDSEKYRDSPRNTIYRQAGYSASAKLILSPRLNLQAAYQYRYEDFGQLIYRDQWAQRVSWDRRGNLPSLMMEWRPNQYLRIAPGYSYERKHSFDHLGSEVPDETIRSERELFKRERIFIDVGYHVAERTHVDISYVRRVQRSRQFADEKSDFLTANVRRLF